MRRRCALLLLVGLVAGCGGPRVELEVGVKEFPSDVLIARARQTPPVPIPVAQQVVRRLPRQLRYEALPALPRIAVPDLCPRADPLGAPKVEAPNRSDKPPVEGTYFFRNEGTFDIAGVKGKVPPVSTRTVKNVKQGSGNYTFDVDDILTAFTISYLVDATGIYITKQVQKRPDGTVTFTPNPAVQVAVIPLENGAAWSDAGTDVNTSWVLGGVVGAQRDEDHNGKPDDADGNGQADPPVPKMRVDACGQWIDAWAVRILGPNNEGPSKLVAPRSGTNLDYTAVYGFATQFGGLAVEERAVWDGVAGGQPFHLDYVTTIAQLPATPK